MFCLPLLLKIISVPCLRNTFNGTTCRGQWRTDSGKELRGDGVRWTDLSRDDPSQRCWSTTYTTRDLVLEITKKYKTSSFRHEDSNQEHLEGCHWGHNTVTKWARVGKGSGKCKQWKEIFLFRFLSESVRERRYLLKFFLKIQGLLFLLSLGPVEM